MSEGGEKTELPTPKKERDARQKGQVARSQEVVTTISMFGTIAVISAMGGTIWSRLTTLIDQIADIAARKEGVSLDEGLALSWSVGVDLTLPILGTVIFLGIAANMGQFGVLTSLQALEPKLERISVLAGFKRIFSAKQLVELLKSIIKIVFLTVLLYIVLGDAIGPFISAVSCGMECMSTVTTSVMNRVLFMTAIAFVIVAVADLFWQRHSHTKSLMMSKEEIKREYKESEGDPHVKGHRKQVAMEMVMGDAPAKKASALVVNPTHIAIALRYKDGETPLPVVTGKGMGALAVDMRADAERAGVPIFHNIALARHLYADADINGFVPEDVFDVVAEILAWVARNEAVLYQGPLQHGDIDMLRGDHHA
jgi:type III secretion protein U